MEEENIDFRGLYSTNEKMLKNKPKEEIQYEEEKSSERFEVMNELNRMVDEEKNILEQGCNIEPEEKNEW